MARAASCSSFPWFVPLLLAVAQAAHGATEEELFFKGARDVNEGSLQFVEAPANRDIHHHYNQITISDASLKDGWVRLDQCHEHLDAVPRAQIVYGQDRIRDIRVQESRNIGEAWVEGNSVQLRDVHPDALICIQAESRALARNGDQSWNLSNGPYMRKFLDGYYPMRVSMAVHLRTSRLRFVDIEPAAQEGFRVWSTANGVGYDTVFQGELRTVIRFDAIP
jgi:hypothetical protein